MGKNMEKNNVGGRELISARRRAPLALPLPLPMGEVARQGRDGEGLAAGFER